MKVTPYSVPMILVWLVLLGLHVWLLTCELGHASVATVLARCVFIVLCSVYLAARIGILYGELRS